MKGVKFGWALLALAAGPLSGCVTAVELPQPLLAYDRDNCALVPDLSSAISLTPEKERASHTAFGPVGADGPCLQGPDGALPYIVFALPEDRDDKTLSVGGALEATRILSPRVSLLAADGSVTRTFGSEDFLYRGPLYSVQLRPRAEEAFILVSAEPARVGQRYDSIVIGTNTTSTYAAGAYINWTSGTDDAQSRVFSYAGTAQVIVYDSDTEETD